MGQRNLRPLAAQGVDEVVDSGPLQAYPRGPESNAQEGPAELRNQVATLSEYAPDTPPRGRLKGAGGALISHIPQRGSPIPSHKKIPQLQTGPRTNPRQSPNP